MNTDATSVIVDISAPKERREPGTRDQAVSAATRAMARTLWSEHYPAGARRTIRSMDPALRTEGAFWRLLNTCVWPSLRRTQADEEAWALIAKCLASFSPGREQAIPFGRAAQLCGISEERLNALLRSSAESLDSRLRGMVRRLDRQGYHVDFTSAAQLIYFDAADSDAREKACVSIARDYYCAESQRISA